MPKRSVVMLGLARDLANPNAIKGEVWTLNDFYVPACYGCSPPFPKFKPHYVFEVHSKDDYLFTDPKWVEDQQKDGRYLGDWKEIYNKYTDAVVSTFPIEGINNQIIFDIDRARKEFGSWALTSTCSYMLIQAFWEGVDYVRLNGFPQVDEGYQFQMPGTHLLIEKLRGMGMLIHNPFEVVWDQMLIDFNWQEFVKIDGIYGYDDFKVPDLYSKDAPKATFSIKDPKEIKQQEPKGENNVKIKSDKV